MKKRYMLRCSAVFFLMVACCDDAAPESGGPPAVCFFNFDPDGAVVEIPFETKREDIDRLSSALGVRFIEVSGKHSRLAANGARVYSGVSEFGEITLFFRSNGQLNVVGMSDERACFGEKNIIGKSAREIRQMLGELDVELVEREEPIFRIAYINGQGVLYGFEFDNSLKLTQIVANK